MKVLWCWRCRMDIPMLDEEEFARWQEAYRSAFAARGGVKPAFALRFGRVDTPPMQARFAAALALYQQMTGMEETHVNAIHHHRISLYGPPCPACEKPLRTPKARMCAACGWGMAQKGARRNGAADAPPE